jgi:YD repeat-containing protein
MDTDYTLTSTSSCTHHTAFDYEACGVELLVDGQEATTADAFSAGQDGGTASFVIRLVKKKSKGEEGGVSSSGLKGGVSSSGGLASAPSTPVVRWSASLGNTTEGYSAGNIQFAADFTSLNAVTESLFEISGNDGDRMVLNDPVTGRLRQVVVPGSGNGVTLIEWKRLGTGMEVSFYNELVTTPPSSGLWTIPTGVSPAVTYVFTVGVSGGRRTIKVVERRPNAQAIIEDSSTYSSTWDGVQLENSSGGPDDPAGETTVTTSVPLTTVLGGSRIETTVTSNPRGVEQRIQRTITRFEWGEETTEERVGPALGAQITSYAYFTGLTDFGYTKLKWVVRPDGDWTRFEYARSGAVSGTYSPWKSSPATPADASVSNCVYESTTYHGVVSRDVSRNEKIVLGRLVSTTNYAPNRIVQVGGRDVHVSAVSSDALPTRSSAVYSLNAAEPWKGRQAWSEDGRGSKIQYTYESGTYDEAGKVFSAGPGFDRREIEELVQGGSGQPVNHFSTKTIRIFKTQSLMTETSQIFADGAYRSVQRLRYQYDAQGHQTHIHTASATAAGAFPSERVIQNTAYLADGRVLSETDSQGLVTEYQYDSRQRPFRRIKPAKGGELASYREMQYDAKGNVIAQWHVAGAVPASNQPTPVNAQRTLEKTFYNAYGDVASQTDTEGLVTSWQAPVYPIGGGRQESYTPPSGIQQTTRYFRDGQVQEIIAAPGSAADDPSPEGRYYDYSVTSDGTMVRRETMGLLSPAVSRSYSKVGQVVREERPAFGGGTTARRMVYDQSGRNVAVASDSLIRMVTQYNDAQFGAMVARGYDINSNGTLDVLSAEPITEFESRIEQIDGNWWSVSRTFQYKTNGTNDKINLGESRRQLTGLSATQESVNVSITPAGRVLRSTTSIDLGSATVTTLQEDITLPVAPVPVSSSVSINGNGKAQTLYPGAGPAVETTTTNYDGLGRTVAV